MFYSHPDFQLAILAIAFLTALSAVAGIMGSYSYLQVRGWKLQLEQLGVFFLGPIVVAWISTRRTEDESVWMLVIAFGAFFGSIAVLGITYKIFLYRSLRWTRDALRYQVAHAEFMYEEPPKRGLDTSEWLQGRWEHRTDESREN